jgi:hypothetical protein
MLAMLEYTKVLTKGAGGVAQVVRMQTPEFKPQYCK